MSAGDSRRVPRPETDGPAVGAVARSFTNPGLVAFEDPNVELDLPIGNDRVVALEFVARDDEGEIVETSERDDGEPFTYLHGHENIVPGLEAALVGKRAGEPFEVLVEPADGYGEVEMEAPVVLSRTMFEGDIEVGDELAFETEEGEEAPLWVVAIEGDEVTVELDHPLAGVRLRYEGRVLAVRDAAELELEQGYPQD